MADRDRKGEQEGDDVLILFVLRGIRDINAVVQAYGQGRPGACGVPHTSTKKLKNENDSRSIVNRNQVSVCAGRRNGR